MQDGNAKLYNKIDSVFKRCGGWHGNNSHQYPFPPLVDFFVSSILTNLEYSMNAKLYVFAIDKKAI